MKRWIAIAAITISLANVGADVTEGEFGAARRNEGAAIGTEGQTASRNETKNAGKRTTYPYYGTLDSIDAEKKILTLRGKKKNRVIQLTAETRFQRDGVKAKLQDGKPGERVSGSVRKNPEGNEEAVTVRFGGKAKD